MTGGLSCWRLRIKSEVLLKMIKMIMIHRTLCMKMIRLNKVVETTGSGLDVWKTSVETSGLGDSIENISESLQVLVSTKPGPGKKRKAKETVPIKVVPKKKKTTTKPKVVETPVQEVPEPAHVNPDSVQSPVKDLLRSHGFSLDSIFKGVEDYASGMRAPPQHRIPVSTHSVADDASVYQESFGDMAFAIYAPNTWNALPQNISYHPQWLLSRKILRRTCSICATNNLSLCILPVNILSGYYIFFQG